MFCASKHGLVKSGTRSRSSVGVLSGIGVPYHEGRAAFGELVDVAEEMPS